MPQSSDGPVLFVCLHGAAKSVVAAAHFERLARARGLAVAALARGTEPDPDLSPAARRGLAAEGLDARPDRPRRVEPAEVAAASRVIAFGCDVGAPAAGRAVEQWDVPAVADGYAAARDAIVARVEALVASLAAAAVGPAERA